MEFTVCSSETVSQLILGTPFSSVSPVSTFFVVSTSMRMGQRT